MTNVSASSAQNAFLFAKLFIFVKLPGIFEVPNDGNNCNSTTQRLQLMSGKLAGFTLLAAAARNNRVKTVFRRAALTATSGSTSHSAPPALSAN